MRKLIKKFLKDYCEADYEMPESDLELKMDNHVYITWKGIDYFMPKDNSLYNEDEELIYIFLSTLYLA